MSRIDTLKAFLKEAPADSFLQHALALEYIKLGNDKDAKALFLEILSKDPSYTGSYYHLGKLLQRTGETEAAIAIYQQGMAACKQAGDNHAYNELQSAYEDLAD